MSSQQITHQIPTSTAREYAKYGSIAAGAIVVAAIPLSATGAVIAGAFGYNPALVGGGIATAAILVAGAFGFDALRVVRWAMVQHVAEHLAERQALTKKTNAEAERILAEADRLDAESKALTTAAQVNLNAGSGKMTVKNQAQPITYKVNGQIVNGNQLNQIQPEPRRIEISAADVRWMLEQIATGYGHSKSKWVKAKIELPYSRQPVTYEIYKAIVDPLANSEPQGIIGRGERASGTLVEHDPAQLVKLIEQTHPDAGSKGITIEAPLP